MLGCRPFHPTPEGGLPVNVPVKAAVPIDVAKRAQVLLDRLVAANQSDLEKHDKRAKAGVPAAVKIVAERMHERRCLTMHNVWRAAIEHGIASLEKMKTEEVAKILTVKPIVMGRPRVSVAG